MSIHFITEPQALEQLCHDLADAKWLALDTEFIRERTYNPQLCLIQIADENQIACIDPLAIDDLSPLLELLARPEITKVFHAARQDLEIFYLLTGSVPAPVFDTQIAATLLGQGDQIGYGNLVKAELGVELDKSQSRTDWAQRPLSEEQLSYAADDVRYLRQLYPQMLERLQELGRETWLEEDFNALADPELYRVDPQQAWRRLKGANRLKGPQLPVLQALAAWREEQAVERDKPRRWIIKDEVLLDLARIMPKDPGQAQRIRGLEESLMKRHGPTLLKMIAEARKLPREQWPQLPAGQRLPPEQEPVVELLAALLRERCQAAGVAPSAVAGKKELEKLLRGEETTLRHGWRHAIAGADLERLLKGELVIRIDNGRLNIESDTQ